MTPAGSAAQDDANDTTKTDDAAKADEASQPNPDESSTADSKTEEEYTPTEQERRRQVMAEGISEKDREYKNVPARDKPHPSTVMRQEVLPGD